MNAIKETLHMFLACEVIPLHSHLACRQLISQTPLTSECIQRNIACIINISFAFFIQALLVRALQPVNEVKATLQGLAISYIFDSVLNLLGLFSL